MENNQSDFLKERLAICNVCPLCNKDRGENYWICTPYVWLNVETNEVSKKYKPGFKNGCGCAIHRKVKHKFNKCPLGKW